MLMSTRGPSPMEIDNVRMMSRDECLRQRLCFNCNKPGHQASVCRTKRRQGKVTESRPAQDYRSQQHTQRDRRTSPMVEHNLATMEELEQPIVYDNAEFNAVELDRKSNLYVVNGRLDGKDVRILIDSGALINLIKRGIAKTIMKTEIVEDQGFDGRQTKKQFQEVEASYEVQGKKFDDMLFTEWDLPNTHDAIFCQPWFIQHNPIIDWRSQTFELQKTCLCVEERVTRYVPRSKMQNTKNYMWLKSASDGVVPVIPSELKAILHQYEYCFPDKLPDSLPPRRAVNIDLQPKSDAIPSARPPFRISKTEQDALKKFVRDNVKKGWIEVSNSPWISNILGVPKKDPATGMTVKRAEWLRRGNTKVPIRWVIDYRCVNSQTRIPEIPLPYIVELFDQMLGATVFTGVDLAQGYHQMRVEPNSRPYTAFRSQK
uniref:H0624F09.1 putative n=1 Tax=Albugo laibachii Nc14 TaxID=890382 RepID=F0WGN7_9STRA|nr:H0624F09.1 putative [Albugo laibachii Nc14]|eukprot:CCA20401.1 H0624F09.1 putative [Albugo laibachii Nc14]